MQRLWVKWKKQPEAWIAGNAAWNAEIAALSKSVNRFEDSIQLEDFSSVSTYRFQMSNFLHTCQVLLRNLQNCFACPNLPQAHPRDPDTEGWVSLVTLSFFWLLTLHTSISFPHSTSFVYSEPSRKLPLLLPPFSMLNPQVSSLAFPLMLLDCWIQILFDPWCVLPATD